MVYRPIVYDKSGNIIKGTWYRNNNPLSEDEDWSSEYNRFFLDGSGEVFTTNDYVYVQHKNNFIGGNGVENIVNHIWNAKLNDKDISFLSIDDKTEHDNTISGRTIPVLDSQYRVVLNDDSTPKYMAYDQCDLVAARVVSFTIKEDEIDDDNTYVVDKQYFGDRNVVGILSCDKKIEEVLLDGETLKIVFNEKKDTNISIALDGFVFNYVKNSRTMVKDMYVCKMITHILKQDVSTEEPIFIEARNENENIGIIKNFIDFNLDPNDTTKDKYVAYVNNKQSSTAILNGQGTPFISVSFKEDLTSGTKISIPLIMTYQLTEDDVLEITYRQSKYQGILNYINIVDGTTKVFNRLSDWKVFSTVMGSSYLSDDSFEKIEREENTILNAIDRLPGGVENSYAVSGEDKIELVGESFINPNTVNNHMRFHTSFSNVLTSSSRYEETFGELKKDILITKKDNLFSLNIVGFQGVDLKKETNKYDGASCLISDDEGFVYVLVVGAVDMLPTKETRVYSKNFDLFKLDNSPLLLSRKVDLFEFDNKPFDVYQLSPISNLEKTFVSHNRIDVGWQFNEDIPDVKFNVTVDDTLYKTVSEKKCVIGGLDPEKEYKISIVVVDSVGNFSDSVFDMFTTLKLGEVEDLLPPSIPKNLKITDVEADSLKLSWNYSVDNYVAQSDIKYNVYKDGNSIMDSDSDGIVYFSEMTGINEILISGLTPETEYTFEVTSHDGNQESEKSNAISAKTLSDTDTTPPTAPTNLTSTIIQGTYVELKWDESTDNVEIEEYRVYKKLQSATNFETTYVSSETTSCRIDGLTNSTAYVFGVKAIDTRKPTGNESAMSNQLAIVTASATVVTPTPIELDPSDTTSTATVKNVKVIDRKTTSIKVSWDNYNISNLSKYNVYVMEWVDGQYQNILLFPTNFYTTTNTQYEVKSLKPNTKYRIDVRAVDKDNNKTNESKNETQTLRQTKLEFVGASGTTTSPYKLKKDVKQTIGVNFTDRTPIEHSIAVVDEYTVSPAITTQIDGKDLFAGNLILVKNKGVYKYKDSTTLEKINIPLSVGVTFKVLEGDTHANDYFKVSSISPNIAIEPATTSDDIVNQTMEVKLYWDTSATLTQKTFTGTLSLSIPSESGAIKYSNITIGTGSTAQTISDDIVSIISPTSPPNSKHTASISKQSNVVIVKDKSLNSPSGTFSYTWTGTSGLQLIYSVINNKNADKQYREVSLSYYDSVATTYKSIAKKTTNLNGVANFEINPDSNKYIKLKAEYVGNQGANLSSSMVELPIKVLDKKSGTFNPSTTQDSYKVKQSDKTIQQVGTKFTMPNITNAYDLTITKVTLNVGGTLSSLAKVSAAIWKKDGTLLTKSTPIEISRVSSYSITVPEAIFDTNNVIVAGGTEYIVGFWRENIDNKYQTIWSIDKSAAGAVYYEDDTASVTGPSKLSLTKNYTGTSLVFKVDYVYWQ